MEQFKTVKLERLDSVAILTFNRPKALNSLSIDLIEDIHAALDLVVERRSEIRALILTGTGRGFCAGGDISAHINKPKDSPPYDLGDILVETFNPLLMRFLELPIPFVVAVNGAAAGAGFPLAICGDVVVAGRSARFQCGFSRIGLMPDLGLSWFLPNLIGRARAHTMLMMDEAIDGEKAESWGLINECVTDASLMERAIEIASFLAGSSIPALIATRKTALKALGAGLSDVLDMEAKEQRTLGYSKDFKEGIEAFFGKRSPDFQDT